MPTGKQYEQSRTALALGDTVDADGRMGRVVRIMGVKLRLKMRDTGDIEEHLSARVVYAPTEDEIRFKKVAIQAKWSKAEEEAKQGIKRVEYEIPSYDSRLVAE